MWKNISVKYNGWATPIEIHTSPVEDLLKGDCDLQIVWYLKQLYLENKKKRVFVLPIFDGVIMDGHSIFWVVDTGVLILS